MQEKIGMETELEQLKEKIMKLEYTTEEYEKKVSE